MNERGYVIVSNPMTDTKIVRRHEEHGEERELATFLRRIRPRFVWLIVRFYNWIEARYRAWVEREAQRCFERGWV